MGIVVFKRLQIHDQKPCKRHYNTCNTLEIGLFSKEDRSHEGRKDKRRTLAEGIQPCAVKIAGCQRFKVGA